MSSNLKTISNRANATHSTGPRTPEGKKRSCLNAMRHGLTGQVIVLPEEDIALYKKHCEEFAEDWHPKGATEKHLVQTLADQQWRLHRAHSREIAAYAIGHDEFGDRIKTGDAAIHAVLTAAVVDLEQSKDLDRISRYASRIQRDYHMTLRELRAMQSERREREQNDLYTAAQIQKLFEMKKMEWNPAEDGFVLTAGQINTYRNRVAHRDDAMVAHRVGFNIEKYNKAVGG